MTDGELKQRLTAAILNGEWQTEPERQLTVTITPILDEAKADFLKTPLWTGNEPDALIKNLKTWFVKWFGGE